MHRSQLSLGLILSTAKSSKRKWVLQLPNARGRMTSCVCHVLPSLHLSPQQERALDEGV